MQTWSRQCRVVGSAVVMVALGACGSASTGPAPTTPAQLAAAFDALFVADTASNPEAADIIAEYAELSPAYGGNEATFTVTTGSGTQTWRGVAYGAIGSAPDTAFFITLYPNRDLDQAVVVVFDGAGGASAQTAATINQFVTVYDGTVSSASGHIVSSGAGCSLETSLAAATLIADWVGDAGNCVLSTVQVSFAASFPDGDNLGALESVSVSNTTMTGPVFTVGGGSHVVGIPSKAAALADRLAGVLHPRQ
jgi:hypothetical protein